MSTKNDVYQKNAKNSKRTIFLKVWKYPISDLKIVKGTVRCHADSEQDRESKFGKLMGTCSLSTLLYYITWNIRYLFLTKYEDADA